MPQRLAAACPVVGLLLLLAVNASLFAYFGCVHQRGAVSVARALRDEAAAAAGTLLQVPPVHVALLSEAASHHHDGAFTQRDEAAAVSHGMAALAAVLSRHQGVKVRTPPGAHLAGKDAESAASAAFADAFRRRVLQHGLRLPLAAFASAHYLVQCHSAPFHATVHSPLMQLVQLDCSPPLPPGGLLGSNGSFPVSKASSGSEHITEAALWRRDPAALLHALYGPHPAAPLLCTLITNGTSTAAAANDGSAAPLALKSAISVHHDLAAATTLHRQFQEVRQLLDADQRQHTSLPAAQRIPEGLAVRPDALAAAAAGVASDEAAPPSGGTHGSSAYRALPTHIVMFDSDAARPAVAAFLRQHGYLTGGGHGAAGQSDDHAAALSAAELAQSGARDFFFAFHSADAHAHSAGAHADASPSRVLLLEHPCWRAARRSQA